MAIVLLVHLPAMAQVIISSGGKVEGSGYNINYSVGEAFLGYYSGEAGSLTIGVQQSWQITVETDVPSSLSNLPEITLFPNPTKGKVFVSINQPVAHSNRYVLLDPQGVSIQHGLLEGQRTSLDLTFLNGSVYFLTVYVFEMPVRTYKLIKSNVH